MTLYTQIQAVNRGLQAGAHGFGRLYNLPVPFWLYAWAASAALLLSFLLAAYFASAPAAVREGGSRDLGRQAFGRWLRRARPALAALSLGLLLLCIASEGEQDVVTTVQGGRNSLFPAHAIGDTVGQAGRPVEDNGQAWGGIQEQPDVGQRPDGEHRKVEIPAATHVGQLVAKGLPGLAIAAHMPGHGRRDADDLQGHGIPTFWRN